MLLLRPQHTGIRAAVAQLVQIAALAIAIAGCQRSKTEVTDKDLAAVRDFVVTHNKNLSYGGDVTTLTTVTSINPKQMSVMLDDFKTYTPEKVYKTEVIFHWDQLRDPWIETQKYGSDLIIRLQPEGVMRVFSSEKGYWGRGAAPQVEFCFSTQAEALKFFHLFSVAAKKFGAKDLSGFPQLDDNRNPPPMTPERRAALDKMMKAIQNDPGFYDRMFPREK